MHGTPEHSNNKCKTKCQKKQVAFNLAYILEIIENGIPEHTHVKKQQKCKTKFQKCKFFQSDLPLRDNSRKNEIAKNHPNLDPMKLDPINWLGTVKSDNQPSPTNA